MSEYFENDDLIFDNQYGFRKNQSTEFASLHLTDYLNFKTGPNEHTFKYLPRFI